MSDAGTGQVIRAMSAASRVKNLFQTADAMVEVARQYGFTDEEIATSFRGNPPDA